MSYPSLGGGYSNVLSGTKRTSTAIELLHMLKLRSDLLPLEAQFSQAIGRSPELRAMYQAALKRGLTRQEAMRAVHHEVASRLVGE